MDLFERTLSYLVRAGHFGQLYPGWEQSYPRTHFLRFCPSLECAWKKNHTPGHVLIYLSDKDSLSFNHQPVQVLKFPFQSPKPTLLSLLDAPSLSHPNPSPSTQPWGKLNYCSFHSLGLLFPFLALKRRGGHPWRAETSRWEIP